MMDVINELDPLRLLASIVRGLDVPAPEKQRLMEGVVGIQMVFEKAELTPAGALVALAYMTGVLTAALPTEQRERMSASLDHLRLCTIRFVDGVDELPDVQNATPEMGFEVDEIDDLLACRLFNLLEREARNTVGQIGALPALILVISRICHFLPIEQRATTVADLVRRLRAHCGLAIRILH